MNYTFSTICVKQQSKQLCIDSTPIDVDERIFGLMLALAQHYPDYCSKTYLLETLWPDTVVSEWSISKLVSETRQLLKSHGIDAEVIQTLHGRGYRIASQFGDKMSISDDPPSAQYSAVHKQNRVGRLAFISLLIIALVVSVAAYEWSKPAPQQPLKKSEQTQSIGRLLWVDDHPENNETEKAYLESHNITVYQVKSSDDALTSLALYDFTLIISDMGRNGEMLAGLNLLKRIRQQDDDTPFVLYTIVLSQAQQDILQEFRGQGVAVEPQKLYELVLPFFSNNQKGSMNTSSTQTK